MFAWGEPTTKDKNGRCSKKEETSAHDLYVLTATQVPAEIRKQRQMVHYSTAFPASSFAEKHPAARQDLRRIVRQRLFNQLFVPASEKQAEKVGLRAYSGGHDCDVMTTRTTTSYASFFPIAIALLRNSCPAHATPTGQKSL